MSNREELLKHIQLSFVFAIRLLFFILAWKSDSDKSGKGSQLRGLANVGVVSLQNALNEPEKPDRPAKHPRLSHQR